MVTTAFDLFQTATTQIAEGKRDDAAASLAEAIRLIDTNGIDAYMRADLADLLKSIGGAAPEHAIGYQIEPTTRFKVRYQTYEGRDPVTNPGVKWIKHQATLTDCQIAYIAAREASWLGGSQFGDGDVFDQYGQHIARISYNGRLWAPLAWAPGHRPIAEAPDSKKEATHA